MRQLWAFPIMLAGIAAAHAGPAERDAHMDDYLAIWSHNATVTPAMVNRIYAPRVDYYGRSMSAAAVYHDKLAFVRRWPERSYTAVPGTVTNDCGGGTVRCRVNAVLRWSRADGAGRHRQSGTNTARLDLARVDGTLKIVRESGEPVSGRR